MEHMSQAINDVVAERVRQVAQEGWTPEHDDEHSDNSLAIAAACYALPELMRKTVTRLYARDVGRSVYEEIIIYDEVSCPENWPWHGNWWKPKTRRADLIRAAALIIAEIERIDRMNLDCPHPIQDKSDQQ